MNRNLALEFIRVTEMAAIASSRWMGKGDEDSADQSAIDAMRTMLDSVDCNAKVIIGEGNEGEVSQLYSGETVGAGEGAFLELSLDALEGKSVCANGGHNSISVIAIAEEGGFFQSPNTYMKKIAVGPIGKGKIDINATPGENLRRLAEAKGCKVQDLTAVILDRDRHQELIAEVRKTGARINLIADGDISASMACCDPKTGVDILFGIGGASEGVISAAALQCMGGDFQCQFRPQSEKESVLLKELGVKDEKQIFFIDDLAKGDIMFCATGVTTGNLLPGVQFKSWGAETHSIVMRSKSGTVRRISAEHHFDTKPRY